MAVFTCYDTVNSKWGNDNTSEAVIDAMCPPQFRASASCSSGNFMRPPLGPYPKGRG